jgi:hypothetical protein
MSQVRTHRGIQWRTVTPTRISRDAGIRPGSPDVRVAHWASRCQGEKSVGFLVKSMGIESARSYVGGCRPLENLHAVVDPMPHFRERFIKSAFNIEIRPFATGGDRDLPSVFRREDQLRTR